MTRHAGGRRQRCPNAFSPWYLLPLAAACAEAPQQLSNAEFFRNITFSSTSEKSSNFQEWAPALDKFIRWPEHISLKDEEKPFPRMMLVDSSRDLSQDLPSENIKALADPDSPTAPSTSALVLVSNVQELAALAQGAHQHEAGALACGRLMQLLPDFFLAAAQQNTGQNHQGLIPSWLPQTEVQASLERVNSDRMLGKITELQALGSRDAYLESAVASSDKVRELFELAIASDPRFAIEELTHDNFEQKSIVVRLLGEDQSAPAIVLGSHLDSINPSNLEDAPGADDNATGVITLVELVHVIQSAQWQFERTIEFHAYAGEEYGLLGSTDIAAQYFRSGKQIAAMLQFDMTGYDKAGSTVIHLIETDTNSILRWEAEQLINNYLDSPSLQKPLRAGTSDHRSFHALGFPALFPFEDPEAYNTSLHTSRDTIDNIQNPALMLAMAKFGLAFVAHYGGLRQAAEVSPQLQTKRTELAKPLAVAIQKNAEFYDFYVASSESQEKLVLCSISQSHPGNCQNGKALYGAKSPSAFKGRFVYHFAKVLLEDQQSYGIFGYDQNQVLTAFRAISLKAKP
jgi:hypothetical protein